ncbi:gamma-glutamyl phosphate reductase [Xanthomonas axonopodis Xac29-1]|nr:gamma-glutamyl phosphate reductase [Xanthomonas axonopodis Xac29-1]
MGKDRSKPQAKPLLRIPNPKSQIPNPESRIPNPESRIPNPESRIPNPESRIPNPGNSSIQRQHHPHQLRRLRMRLRLEAQRFCQLQHRHIALQHIAEQAIQVLAPRPLDQLAHQLPSQPLAGDEAADQDGVFRLAGARYQRGARDRADQRFAGRQLLGGDQHDLALGIGMGQALHHLRGDFGRGAHKARANFLRSQQAESSLQRRTILGTDRAKQKGAAIGQAEVFMPGRHAIANGHDRCSLKIGRFWHQPGAQP